MVVDCCMVVVVCCLLSFRVLCVVCCVLALSDDWCVLFAGCGMLRAVCDCCCCLLSMVGY